MGRASRRRGTRRHKLREADERYGPDRSRIIYRDGDGWTIRQPTTHTDVLRTGRLIRNCLRTEPDYGIGPSPHLRTLNDPDGYPRLVFHHVDGDSMDLGAYAQRDPNPEHVERLRAWHRAQRLGHVSAHWREAPPPDLDAATPGRWS